MIASPINPSDREFAAGTLLPGLAPAPPVTLGIEGCGRIDAVGPEVPEELIGRKVSFFRNFIADPVNGTWA